ncbi:hypothetical protein FPV16_25080 [Methylobacterium sp. W2]|uniref:hypothetical protein n=1 Tax=Methylobacterium sp. W2 TaxID=2598107 RepID=UPI001D0C2661|nr:hypothetical protein [Methylobacterium sp. W2]MCC0809432.1 hypothetical protein [Methylobacterium sp. W2]
MLNGPDLSGFDLAALAAGLEASALRQDRHRRLADSIGVPADCPETSRAVAAIDADAAATAEAHRLVSLLWRFAIDEGHTQPGLLARAFGILNRGRTPVDATFRLRDRNQGASGNG